MKKPILQDIIFQKTIPKPKQNDPVSFFGHVQRNLVPEVRLEVQTFYGGLDCLEAQYPGLDYTFAPHRRRLARYPWHRRLFRTFDELRLTDGEILSLCQWEGTKSAKERYERETKKKILDTTADDVVPAPEGHGPRARVYKWAGEKPSSARPVGHLAIMKIESQAEQSEDEDEDDLSCGHGLQLNQQLQAAAEAPSLGDLASIDPQWEQWMKEALERSDSDREDLVQAIREGRPFPPTTSGVDRPESSLATEVSTSIDHHTANSARTAPRRYTQMRSMLRELQSVNNRLAADNAAMAMMLSRSRPETAR